MGSLREWAWWIYSGMYHPIPFLFWQSPSHFPLMRRLRILYDRYQTQGPCTIVKYLTGTQPGTPNSVTVVPSSSSLWRIICMMRLVTCSYRRMSMIGAINPSQRISLAPISGPSHIRRIEANRYTIHLFFYVYYWSNWALLSIRYNVRYWHLVQGNGKSGQQIGKSGVWRSWERRKILFLGELWQLRTWATPRKEEWAWRSELQVKGKWRDKRLEEQGTFKLIPN